MATIYSVAGQDFNSADEALAYAKSLKSKGLDPGKGIQTRLDKPFAGSYNYATIPFSDSFGNDGSSSTGSTGSTGSSGSTFGGTDDFKSLYKDLADQQFDQTKSLMGLTNQFREKEGATQAQIDAQASKRQTAELEARKYTLNRTAEITETQRGNDAARAQAALRKSKSFF